MGRNGVEDEQGYRIALFDFTFHGHLGCANSVFYVSEQILVRVTDGVSHC